MTHSNLLSENGGLSKALIMGISMLTAPEPINVPMDYSECWTPYNIRRCFVRFIPIVNALAEALTYFFWVSFFFFTIGLSNSCLVGSISCSESLSRTISSSSKGSTSGIIGSFRNSRREPTMRSSPSPHMWEFSVPIWSLLSLISTMKQLLVWNS